MKKIITNLTVLASIVCGFAHAETYIYTGNNFTTTLGAYAVATEKRVTGWFTTAAPIPPNTVAVDIRTIAITWSFDDGVQTITNENGVFHPNISANFSTDSAGNITRGNVWIGNKPLAIEVGQKNDLIATSFTGGDWGSLQATCTTPLANPCVNYLWGPDRGLVFSDPGAWTIAAPTYSVGGSISGLKSTVTLQNKGADDLEISANGNFTFETEVENDNAYNVTVSIQPTDQTCTVSNASGTISGLDITNVSVVCVTREFKDELPSGRIGGISFTSDDPGCTFDPPPEFLPVGSVSPQPQSSVTPIDGVVGFTIDSCTFGATVTISVDYGRVLPPETTYWKVGDPWFKIPSTVEGTVIKFNITDGGPGDDTGKIPDGLIVDPGGASIEDLETIMQDGFESK